jgi:transmembrane sensor
METHSHLKTLLDKFHQGTASQDELQMLYRILNNHDRSELDAIMAKEWSEVAFSNGEIDSLSLLETIRDKVGTGTLNIEESATAPEKNNRFNIPAFLRYAAIFVIAIGLTWFLKPSSTTETSAVKPHYFTIKVAYGSKTTIELPDSSTVILNSGSTLSYPDKFETESRTVKLTGEAFFEVKKNSKRPFYVQTKDVTIRVLGTVFNVKSYPDENTSETTLVSGSVEILQNSAINEKTKNKSIASIFLKPNQKAIFTRETGNTELKELKKELPAEKVKTEPASPIQLITQIADQGRTKTEMDIAWKNNKLILNNDRFEEIIRKLERWYNVKITLQDPSLADDRFSAKFDRESISDVLNALNIIEPFHYEINKNMITIFKK